MLFRRLLFLSGILLFPILSFGGEIDSLKHRVSRETDQRELGKLYSRLGWLHIVSDPATAESYIDSAIQNYRAIGDSAGIANSWYRFGVLYRFTGDFTRADSLMDLNLAFSSAKVDTFKVVNALFQKGVIYSLQGRFDKSLDAYFTILEVYESLADSTSMGFTLNSIGIVFKNMRKFNDAEAVLKRSVAIHRDLNDRENLANALSNLGSVYAEKGNHKESISYFQEAKEIDRELGIRWGEAMNEMNEGIAYLNLGRLDEALAYLQRARNIQKSNGYRGDLAESLAKLGRVYLGLDYLDSAKAVIQEGLALEVTSFTTNLELYSSLSEALEANGDFKEALAARKKEALYQDSIFNETNAKMANVWAAEYGVKEKDFELAQKDQLLEERDSTIDRMETRTIAAIGIGGFALVLTFLIWLFYRQQQKLKNEEIQNLQRQKEISSLESYIQGEENERKRLARDLHDGLNGDLSVVKYKVSSLDENLLNPESSQRRREAIELLDKACEQVRSISHNLAPQVLKEFSLKEAIEQFIARINNATKIEFSFLYFGESPRLGLEKETVIFRMIQEMVNNIIKHSRATEALIQFNRHASELVLTVEDNGKGFDRDEIDRGMGLKTIRSRIDYLNADCEFSSNSEGTTYVVHVPLTKKVLA